MGCGERRWGSCERRQGAVMTSVFMGRRQNRADYKKISIQGLKNTMKI